jgi:hypothetical protein
MAKRKPVFPPNYDRLEGKHFLTAGKETISGLFATYDEARQAKAEMFPTGKHPESGKHIEVSYHPTRKQIRRWDRQDRALKGFYVTGYQVVEDRKTERGRLIGLPLSRMFSTRQACRKALAQIKGVNPRAYMGGGTYFFHPGSRQDIEARKRILDEMRGLAT